MLVNLKSATKNNTKKMTKEEGNALTEGFRKRLKKMETDKEKHDLEKKIARAEKKATKLAYEEMEYIKFPFLTFRDDNY
jgi:hypothetical protein